MKIGILQGIIFCFSIAAYGQDLPITSLLDSARSCWYLDFDKTDALVRRAERLSAVRGAANNLIDLIDLYNLRIQSCNAFNRFQLWRRYVNELEGFLEENKKAISPEKHKWFSLLNSSSNAQYLATIGDYSGALELFVSLWNQFKNMPRSAEVCDQLNSISSYIADIHQQNGEYEAAINQDLSSLTYSECFGLQASYYTLVYRNIGLNYFKKKDFKQAGKYLKLAEDSLQQPLRKTPAKVARIALSLYESESFYYDRIDRHDSAMLSMRKAIPLLKLRNVDDGFKGRINLSLGNLYLREDKFTLAQSHLEQAERFFMNSLEDQPIHLSMVYLVQSNIFERLGKITDALKFCGKAIERLVLNFKPDADGNPNLDELISKKQVFRVLQKKSQLLEKLFLEERDIKILNQSVNTNKLALALLDSTANEISLDKDKVILAEESFSAFEDGIRITYALYKQTGDKKYLDDCFTLVDKSKGILLLENLRSVNRFAGINPEWLSREKEIKSEILLTEQDLFKTENKNSSELAVSRERYATLKQDYATLISKIKTEAPDYYRLRFDHAVISTGDVQSKSLQNAEAMIEYFVGDSTLAIVGLSGGKRYVDVKRIRPDFFEKISQFKSILTTSDGMKEDPLFTKLSSDLYVFLMHDALQELGPGITSLTIIPDGILGYIPFEVFRGDNEKKNKYLGEEFTIRYAYSATYLKEQMQKRNTAAKYFFAGFVSSDAENINNQKLAALPGAKREISTITELLGSSYSIFNPALKEEFLNNASDFSILHLAMHSLVNDENPMFSTLVFSPSVSDSADNRLLTALELYNMNLNSDLAVLSACNTGFGTLHRGEGIMSFARAFAYAGVPSAVISLWQVPDKATSKIMLNFYKYLKAGESKDRALQHAKSDFIRDYPQMSAPLYWAGFILTGSKEPVRFPSSWLLYWIIAGLLMAEFFLLAANRKMSHAKV